MLLWQQKMKPWALTRPEIGIKVLSTPHRRIEKLCLLPWGRSKNVLHWPGSQAEKESPMIIWDPKPVLHQCGTQIHIIHQVQVTNIKQNTNKFNPRHHGKIEEHQIWETKFKNNLWKKNTYRSWIVFSRPSSTTINGRRQRNILKPLIYWEAKGQWEWESGECWVAKQRDVLRTEQEVTSKLPNSQVRSGQGNVHCIWQPGHYHQWLWLSGFSRGMGDRKQVWGDQIQHKEMSFYLPKPLTSNT